MSELSKLLNKSLGIPEINLLKQKDPALGSLVEHLVSDKVGELLKKLPDVPLAALLQAAKVETRRRLDEAGGVAAEPNPPTYADLEDEIERLRGQLREMQEAGWKPQAWSLEKRWKAGD